MYKLNLKLLNEDTSLWDLLILKLKAQETVILKKETTFGFQLLQTMYAFLPIVRTVNYLDCAMQEEKVVKVVKVQVSRPTARRISHGLQ